VTDFLETKRKETDDRLKELKPLVGEHRRLEAATRRGGGAFHRGVRTQPLDPSLSCCTGWRSLPIGVDRRV